MFDKSRYEKMQYNYCGKSGLKLPAISLGLWHNFGEKDTADNMRALLKTSFDNGITHFDLANNYGPPAGRAEENFGKILRDDFKSYRNELVISTKAGYYMHPGPYGDFGSRKYLMQSVDESLKRMKIDYVDIFYHHRPDPNTPIEETMGALDSIVKSGKALYAGVSNYTKADLEKALPVLIENKTPFIANQVAMSIFNRDKIVDGCAEFAQNSGVGLTVYSPLAQGLLTDRYIRGIPQDSRIGKGVPFLKESALTSATLNAIIRLKKIAERRGQTLAQLALSWVLAQKAVATVIIGASKTSQILDNLGALNSEPLTQAEIEEIEKAGERDED